MGKMILEINFNYDGSLDDAAAGFAPLAQPIADFPSLSWKIWCWSDDGPEFAGVYLFEDESSVNNYLNSSIVEQVKQHPSVSNIRAKAFAVAEQPSAATRAPV